MQSKLVSGRYTFFLKIAIAAAFKALAALSGFALTAIVTRNMSVSDAGQFLLAFSLLVVMSVFFRLGLDNVVLRYLSAEGISNYGQEKLNRGLLWVATATLPITILGMIFSQELAVHIFHKPEFAEVLYWMLLALPPMALFFILSMAFQSQQRVILTTIFQNLGISSIFVIGFAYLLSYEPRMISAISSAKLYALSAVIVWFVGSTIWFYQRNVRFWYAGFKDKDITSASMNLWGASIMSMAVQWTGILVAGAVLASEDVALLSAAQRTAMLTSFIIMVVNMVVAPRYALLWKSADFERIQYIAAWSTRGMALLAIPLAVLIIVYAEKIMQFFGDSYIEAAGLLIILTLGQVINVITGTVGSLLYMTGHEKEYNRVTLVVGPITILIVLLLTNYYGVYGAAIATAIGVALQNISELVVVKRKLGFIPLLRIK